MTKEQSDIRAALLAERDYLLELQAKYGKRVCRLDEEIREISNKLQKREWSRYDECNRRNYG